jgi:twitching motility protein PilI
MDVDINIQNNNTASITDYCLADVPALNINESPKEAVQNRYGFMLGNIGLLIAENTLSEVMKAFRVYPVPNTKSWLQGLTNLRGNLVPVYDLGLFLDIVDTPIQHNNLLVLDKGEEAIGILVDSLPIPHDTSTWKRSKNNTELPTGLKNYIDDVYDNNGVLWGSFNHRQFFEAVKSAVSI